MNSRKIPPHLKSAYGVESECTQLYYLTCTFKLVIFFRKLYNVGESLCEFLRGLNEYLNLDRVSK